MLQAFISLLSIKLPSSTKRYLTDWRVWASFQQFNSKFQYESNSCQERKEILCCRLIPSSFSLLLQILRAKQSRLPTECHCGGKSSASLWSRFCALTRHVFYPRLGITSCLDSAWSLPPLCVGGGGRRAGFGNSLSYPLLPNLLQQAPSTRDTTSWIILFSLFPPGSDQLLSLRLQSLGSSARKKWHQPLFSQFYL